MYVTSDPYGDSTLEVCQVKNTPFHGRSGEGSTSAILDQMIKCKKTHVLNPKTSRKERPQVVSLWTTYPLPDRDTADSHGFLEELHEQRCKLIGPEKILALLKRHLPKEYQRLAYPGEGIRNALRIYLQTHHEAVAFETQRIRVLSDFFVDMGLSHDSLGRIVGGSHKRDEAPPETRIPMEVYRDLMDLYNSLPEVVPISVGGAVATPS